MTTGERNVLAWIEAADFTNQGCRHSQQTIADALGYTRQHVNRCVQSLAKTGRLTISKERRPGSKWPHNVYRVRQWNPHKRAGVLNVLGSIRERRSTQCDTERTAGLSRAHTTLQAPRPQCWQYHSLWSREAQEDSRNLEVRVAENCPDCAAKDALLRDLSEKNSEMAEEVSAQTSAARREARGRLAADRKLAAFLEANPAADDVTQIIEYWKRKTGHATAKCRLDDTRGRAVAKALKHYSKTELLEMVDGIALAPFVKFGKRHITGTDDQRYDALEFALKSDARVWECIEIARRAGSASIDALNMAYQRVAALEREYMTRFHRHPGFIDFAMQLGREMALRKEAA